MLGAFKRRTGTWWLIHFQFQNKFYLTTQFVFIKLLRFYLTIICTFNIKIKSLKTKLTTKVWRLMIINDKNNYWKVSLWIEQVSQLQYLGFDITYDFGVDTAYKVHSFQAMYRTMNRTWRSNNRREIQIKFYKVIAAPVIMHGLEISAKNLTLIKFNVQK